MALHALFTDKEVMILNLVVKFWRQMMIMEPIFTLITLNHIVFNVLEGMRLFAIAVAIKKVLIIEVI